MGVYLVYLQLELKKAGKVLPRFIAGAIVLAVILGTIAFSAGKILYGDAVIGRVNIGVVLPQQDTLAVTAVRMLTSLESVKSVCDFHHLDEADGRKQMEEGKLHALMLVPDGFVDDIINGENTPITIVLPNNPGMEAMVFKELADAGARTLGVAQGSIYAVDELCIRYEMSGAISQVEDELNRIYLAYSLPRADYYRDFKVSAVGDVTVVQYYAISAALLFLFLCGIPLAALCEPDKQVLETKLRSIGIGMGLQVLAKITAVFALLLFVSGVGMAALAVTGVLPFQMGHIAAMLIVCLVIAAMTVAVYRLAGSPIAGVMCLFWLTVGMLFLSGGFVPSVFLPEVIRQVRWLIPTTPLIEIMKVFAGVGMTAKTVLASLFWGVVCYLAAAAVRRRI